MFSTEVVTLDQRAAFIDLLAARHGSPSHELGEPGPDRSGRFVRVRANRVISRMSAPAVAFIAESSGVDLGAMGAAFAERLLAAGLAITPEQTERCIGTLQAHTPPSRRSLYYLTREIFVTDGVQLTTFNEVFADLFGAPAGADRYREQVKAVAVAAI